MWFDPASGSGYVLLTNGGAYFRETEDPAVTGAMTAMNAKLLTLARALP